MTERLYKAIQEEIAKEQSNSTEVKKLATRVYLAFYRAVGTQLREELKYRNPNLSYDEIISYIRLEGKITKIYDPKSDLPYSRSDSKCYVSPGLVDEWIENPEAIIKYIDSENIGGKMIEIMLNALESLGEESSE